MTTLPRIAVSKVAVALWRFPLAILSALVVCGVLVALAQRGTSIADWTLQRVLIAAALGVPAGVWSMIAAERRDCSRRSTLLIQAGILGLMALYWGWLPGDKEAVSESLVWRSGILLLALHLGVSVGGGQREGARFWSFNWTLFSRYWVGALYALVFYAGLALALASAVKLFGFEIKPERYLQLWTIVTFGFHPLFLLAGIPRVSGPETEVAEPSRGLRIFAGGVLLPLVGVYLAILYPYAGKILITREWPEGWVAVPVLGLAVIGLLALLLLQPLTGKVRWAEWYVGRWFGRLLVPMAGLLGAGVWVRTSAYGLTESRYIGLILAGWLAGIGLYFGTGETARRALKVIPWSLLILCVVMSVGPWSLFAMAERSQVRRLDELLTKHELLADGLARPKAQTLDAADYDNLRSVIDYLHSRHRSMELQARLGTWVQTNPAVWKERWGIGRQALDWLQVERDDAEYLGSSFAWIANTLPVDGFVRATFVDLVQLRNTFAGDGLQLRLAQSGSNIDLKTTEGWVPFDELNQRIQGQIELTKPGSENQKATLWADVTLASGEVRRVVVLQVSGRQRKKDVDCDLWRLELLVLAQRELPEAAAKAVE